MRLRLSGPSAAAATADLVGVGFLIAPMIVAAAAIVGLIALSGLVIPWSWYLAVILAPVLYVIWLTIFLAISAAIVRSIGGRYPKPRFRVVAKNTELKQVVKDDINVVTAIVCYRRLALISGLPLVQLLGSVATFSRLVLRAYAPSSSIGQDVTNWGRIYDPDLTEIGNQVVIGGGAVLVAHSVSIRADGSLVYLSSPIRIGDRATIGGESRVGLGTVIEHDAIVEPGAVVAAMTHIPAGQVWGGNPAQYRRTRDEFVDRADTAPQPPIPANVVEGAPTEAEADLRRLVLTALDIAPDAAPDDLSSDTCSSWDSLGQLAIAAAIFDRYGVSVDEEDIYRLRTLHDIDDAIHNRLGTLPAPPNGATNGAVVHVPAPITPDLPDDIDMLPLLDHQEATRALAAQPPTGPDERLVVPVTIAASFTAQPLASSLRLWGAACGFDLPCSFADYDQIIQTLLDEHGPFGANRAGVKVVLTRPEDLWAGSNAATQARIEQIADALQHFVSIGPMAGELLVGTLPPLVSSAAPIDRATAESIRRTWSRKMTDIAGITLFDFATVIEEIGIERARDDAGEMLSRAPYSPRAYQELGIALARTIRGRRRSPAKAIAIDCDNTLWGGVIGEVGMDGIELGPDGPGRAYQLFQMQLKRLKERGVLLAVVSRNEEADVLEVFERHPGMILRPEDIATWSVNWNHKSENLRTLADEMNLGLDAFVFLDDDPAVRLEVATRVPEVHVVPMPTQPTAYADTLARLWIFDGAQATAVDAARTRMMQEEGRRRRESTKSASLEDFLASLDLHVDLHRPDDQEWARVAQLTQRTNQFNLSLKRRTVEEVRAFSQNAAVLVLNAADRFGDYGLVGVVFVCPPDEDGVAEIDTLLMSCRALGRGVEDAFLAGIADLAVSQGATRLVAPYIEGKRNAMVLDYLRRSGFTEVKPAHWELSLLEPPTLPAHVTFRGPLLSADVTGG